MDIISLFLIFIAIEIFESNWQKSDTLHGVIYNNYTIYKKSILLFFLLNLSFIYSIFLVIYLQNNSFLMLSIVGVKFLDISLKLTIMKKIEDEINIEDILPNVKMTFLSRYINALIYPLTFILSVNYFNL
ncbi:hypothetical protein [Halarcobacter sp.]|uniref:hypothetical protein n=1 Tax=Halarcobacter sp. TaxID=2321133 RepID=UPI002AA7541E|nr:hypothetical protein [Halarcobacter sp.]